MLHRLAHKAHTHITRHTYRQHREDGKLLDTGSSYEPVLWFSSGSSKTLSPMLSPHPKFIPKIPIDRAKDDVLVFSLEPFQLHRAPSTSDLLTPPGRSRSFAESTSHSRRLIPLSCLPTCTISITSDSGLRRLGSCPPPRPFARSGQYALILCQAQTQAAEREVLALHSKLLVTDR